MHENQYSSQPDIVQIYQHVPPVPHSGHKVVVVLVVVGSSVVVEVGSPLVVEVGSSVVVVVGSSVVVVVVVLLSK